MNISMLEKIIANDAVNKKQENITPAPEKDNNVESKENNVEKATDSKPGNEGQSSKQDSNENSTDVKQNPESSKDNADKKVDKSKLSHEEKMTYSFRKQFGQQEKKHLTEIENLRKEIENLKKSVSKKDEIKITRDNFESDEEYHKYLIKEEATKLFNESKKKDLEERMQAEKQNAAVNERSNSINERVETLYKTEKEKELYNTMVKDAIENGLEEFLQDENEDKTILKFIDNSTIGPRILQHLIFDKKLLNEIYEMKDIVDKKVELKLLEKQLKSHFEKMQVDNNQTENKDDKSKQSNKESIPVIGQFGKLGVGNDNKKLSKAEEEAEAIRYLKQKRII